MKRKPERQNVPRKKGCVWQFAFCTIEAVCYKTECGHYVVVYDTDNFEKCPKCGAPIIWDNSDIDPETLNPNLQ